MTRKTKHRRRSRRRQSAAKAAEQREREVAVAALRGELCPHEKIQGSELCIECLSSATAQTLQGLGVSERMSDLGGALLGQFVAERVGEPDRPAIGALWRFLADVAKQQK